MSTPVVVAASHHGTVASGFVTWRSHYVLSAPGRDVMVVFAQPVAASSVRLVLPSSGVTETNARGDIVSISVPLALSNDLVLETAVPAAGALSPPLASGDALQRISLDGAGEPMFEVAPGLGVVRHVGYAASGDLGHLERSRCDAMLASNGEPDRADAIYVRATGAIAETGLVGHVSTRAERSRPAAIGAVVAFAVIVAALIALVKHLGREARVERAEKDLEDAFRKMGADETR